MAIIEENFKHYSSNLHKRASKYLPSRKYSPRRVKLRYKRSYYRKTKTFGISEKENYAPIMKEEEFKCVFDSKRLEKVGFRYKSKSILITPNNEIIKTKIGKKLKIKKFFYVTKNKKSIIYQEGKNKMVLKRESINRNSINIKDTLVKDFLSFVDKQKNTFNNKIAMRENEERTEENKRDDMIKIDEIKHKNSTLEEPGGVLELDELPESKTTKPRDSNSLKMKNKTKNNKPINKSNKLNKKELKKSSPKMYKKESKSQSLTAFKNVTKRRVLNKIRGSLTKQKGNALSKQKGNALPKQETVTMRGKTKGMNSVENLINTIKTKKKPNKIKNIKKINKIKKSIKTNKNGGIKNKIRIKIKSITKVKVPKKNQKNAEGSKGTRMETRLMTRLKAMLFGTETPNGNLNFPPLKTIPSNFNKNLMSIPNFGHLKNYKNFENFGNFGNFGLLEKLPNLPNLPNFENLKNGLKELETNVSETKTEKTNQIFSLNLKSLYEAFCQKKEVKKVSKKEKTKKRHERIKNFYPPLKLYESVKKNVYKTLQKPELAEMKCVCVFDKGDLLSACGCPSVCVNRATSIECDVLTCPMGEKCLNRRIQTSVWPKVGIKEFEKKGFGLIAKEEIQEEQFICEYFGEIIDLKECVNRITKRYKTLGHSYIFSISKNEFIDATKMGNLSRFINHSCDPNIVAEVWEVNGEKTVAFFAKKRIKNNEEITYDYNYLSIGQEQQRCYCGSKNCRGFINEKKNSKQKFVPPRLRNKRKRKCKVV